MTYLKHGEWRDLNNNKIKTAAQIVTAQKTDAWYSSSTTFVDVPGLAATITPYYATSKILVIIKINITQYGHSHTRLLRNGTLIAAGDQRGNRTSSMFANYGTTGYNTTGYEARANNAYWLDSPATTSAVTYKIQWANVWSSSYYCGINYCGGYDDGDAQWNWRGSSSITLMEIIQ